MKRSTKEYKIENSNNFKIKLGSTTYKNPEIVYILGNTYISPITDKNNFKDDIELLKLKFKNHIKDYINNSDIFENKFVCDFNIRESGIKKNKKSFFSFEIYFKQNANNIVPLVELSRSINTFTNDITAKITTDLQKLQFISYKSKSC